MDYEQFSQRPSSEKVVLAWLEPAQRLMVWSLHSGSIYSKAVPEFVINVIENGTALTQVASIVAINSAGKWYFDATAKTLYVRTVGSVDPTTVFLRADYRLFFSNGPFDLPWDLVSGTDVEYLPNIQANSDFGYEIDLEQFGTALQGQGDLSFFNLDGYFDSRFEKYWWENKNVTVWSWSPNIALSERKKIYRGLIAAKSFSGEIVTFSLKDFISKLNNNVSLELFDGTEGDVQDSYIGTAKRRVYGRVSGLQVVGLDSILDGYPMTGTVSGVTDTAIVTGVGTVFLDEASPDDDIFFEEFSYRIKSVDSNTQITLTTELENNLTSNIISIKPKIPWRKKNRTWLIAGHALKKIASEVVSSPSGNRLEILDATEFQEGDTILVVATKAQVRRKAGNLLILEQNLGITPSPGDEVSRYPLQSVNEGTRDFIFIRDFEVDNQTTGAKLVMDPLAEFNIARQTAFLGSATFTNASRIVSGSGTSFLSQLRPRDWIRPDLGTWYEILSVDTDTQLTIRIAFAQSTVTDTGEMKNVTFISDDSIITVDCFGKSDDGTEDGAWLKTGPQVVRDLLIEAGLEDELGEASFVAASEESGQVVSLKLPLGFSSKSVPSIKDGIDRVNESVMGAVNFNSDFEIEYNVLNSKKPPELIPIGDDDILEWRIASRVDAIAREVICRYRHQDADRFTGEESSSFESWINEVAEKLSDSLGTKIIDTYLYETLDAQTAAQRYALYNESSTSTIQIATKLNLSTRQLAGKLYLSLDRLFHRLGSPSSRTKIGIITAITKDGLNTLVRVEDISGIWNKVCSITEDDADVHASADEDQRTRNGYIADDNGLVTGNDWTYRTNLIG